MPSLLRLAAAACLAAATATGCHLVVGIDDFDPGEDPVISGDITGSAALTVITERAPAVVPVDWSGHIISAYLVDAAGEMTAYPGTGRADGTFVVPGVPPSTDYYLRIELPESHEPVQVYRLSGRTVDLSRTRMGEARPEMPLDLPSPIALTADGLEPLESQDRFQGYVPGSARGRTITFDQNAPLPAASRLSAATFEWDAPEYPLLGDDLWVVQMRDGQVPGTTDSGSYALAAARIPSVQQAAGATVQGAGSFTRATPTTTGLIAEVAPLRQRGGSYIDDVVEVVVYAAPGGGRAANVGAYVFFWRYQPTSGPLPGLHPVMYGDPFPEGWSRRAEMEYRRQRRIISLDPQPSLLTFTPVDRLVSYAHTTTSEPALPKLDAASARWAQQITVDGAPLERTRAPNGEGLRLSWDPVPGADHYQVEVGAFILDGGSLGYRRTAQLATAAPEVIVPPDLVPGDARVLFEITAIVGGAPLEPAPHASAGTGLHATVSSDVLYTSATCGNGVTEAGEACDAGGQTGACDFDCSAPRCGDGVLNVAAGEQCDTGWHEGTCDAQCRAIP